MKIRSQHIFLRALACLLGWQLGLSAGLGGAALPVAAQTVPPAKAPEQVYNNERAGYRFTYPAHWFPSGLVYANAFEIRNYDAKNPAALPEQNRAQVVITETLNDSAAVTERFLDQLQPQIPFDLVERKIDGYRAVKLTRLIAEQRLGAGAFRSSSIQAPDKSRAFYLTETYIAYGKLLLSIQATVPVDADPRIIAETARMDVNLRLRRAN